jgi:hypothetical protein
MSELEIFDSNDLVLQEQPDVGINSKADFKQTLRPYLRPYPST